MMAEVLRPAPIVVRAVGWQGLYCAVDPGGAPPRPIENGFAIAFYPERDRRPYVDMPISRGAYSRSRVAHTAERTFTGHCGAAQTGIRHRHYEVSLDEPVRLEADTRYWLGIHALVERTDFAQPSFVYWAWDGAAGVPGVSLQYQPGGYFRRFDQPRLFELIE